MASRATRRCRSRSPRLDPSATYAMSRIARPDDRHLDVSHGSSDGRVRFADRDARADHGWFREHATADGFRELLEIQQVGRLHRGADLRVHPAIVHDPVVPAHPDGEIDLEGLRMFTLMRQDADDGVKGHPAQRDLVALFVGHCPNVTSARVEDLATTRE